MAPPQPVNVATVNSVLVSLAKHIQSGGKAAGPPAKVVPPPKKGFLVDPKLARLGEIRAALVQAVFMRLDVDDDEVLSPAEMRRFAELTGFTGSEEEWAIAFKALMTENGIPHVTGVDLELFAKLVEDKSAETGCHCTDAELRSMLERLPAPSDLAPASVPRVDLIAAVFKQLDVDCDGKLSAREMRKFAEQTGFDGSEDMWAAEYRSLCSDSGSGAMARLDLAFFSQLVNDRSADTGCYCSDDELHAMLAKLGGEILVPAGPLGSLPKAGVPYPMSTYRSQLVRSLFDRLDVDRDGRLNAAEMRAFAGHTGFECSEAIWEQEYRQLCEDNGRSALDGVDYVFFCKLVNDQSQDTGCYCTDPELQTMLAKMGGPVAPAPKAGGGGPVVGGQDRFNLVRSVFQAFDADQDGRLNKKEMGEFAASTGFDSGEAAWSQAYDTLCKEKKRDPENGVDLNFFTSLVNDKDDSTGCFCTDGELMEALASKGKPVPLPQTTPKAKAPAPAAASSSDGARKKLVESVFELLDADNDGRLSSSEMKRFAVMTGFEGSEADWASAYAGLCKDAGGGDMVDPQGFATLVNDPSEDTGCHCTDADLRGMLDKLKAPAVGGASSSAALPPRPPGLDIVRESDPSKMSREQLIRAVFAALDVDKDALLSAGEMRSFAEHTGFKGNSLEASGKEGLLRDIVFFMKFVNDKSDDTGCYCTDEEMRSVLAKLAAQSAAGAATSSQAAPAAPADAAPSRAELVASVFRRLDADGDGKLDPKEMRRFAEQQDFDGSDEEWLESYKELCEEKGRDPANGVDLDLFTQLVNDMSEDTGCHCTDAELRAMLSKLPGN